MAPMSTPAKISRANGFDVGRRGAPSDVVKLLLDHGADWKAISFDRNNVIPKLSAASSITPMAKGGLTALDFAAREGDVESAALDAGRRRRHQSELDADNTHALTVAMMNKQLHVCQVPAGSRRQSEPRRLRERHAALRRARCA